VTKPSFMFCDIETTGLDPQFDVILEVGFALTNADLEVLNTFSLVCNWQGIFYDQIRNEYEVPFGVSDTVVKMHDKSGLWEASYRSPLSAHEALAKAEFWITQVTDPNDIVYLAGNTIGFDKSFLDVNYPAITKMFHYRSVDISSIKITADTWCDEKYLINRPAGNKLHRVMPDIQDSIMELSYYKARFFDE